LKVTCVEWNRHVTMARARARRVGPAATWKVGQSVNTCMQLEAVDFDPTPFTLPLPSTISKTSEYLHHHYSPTYQVGSWHGSMLQLQHSLVTRCTARSMSAQSDRSMFCTHKLGTALSALHAPHRPIPLPFVSSAPKCLLRKAGRLLLFISGAVLGALSRLLSCSSPLMPLHTTAWHCSFTPRL
jgi:hypothetical protein